MQKLLNEWRAYIREAKKPTTYRAGTIKCPGGATGVAGYVETPKGRKLVKFCPSESQVKADAEMKLYKGKIDKLYEKLNSKEFKEALNYLKDNIKDKSIYNKYKFLISEPIDDIIGEFDPWEPGSKMDGIRTKENYEKKFKSIMDKVTNIYYPFKNISIELQENIPMQMKLGVLYDNVQELFKNIGEYHKASIRY
jgi:hypothetical protein